MEAYAGEHSTPAQRFFNVLCIAYGADPKTFSEIVSRGHLPESPAEYCYEEYEQVQYTFEKLVGPHIGQVLAEEVRNKSWLREPEQ
jgi:hypothetical protein